MAAQNLKIELNIKVTKADDKLAEFQQELTNRLMEVLMNEYSKDGEDLMGYEGPFVKKVTAATPS